jgi:predicted transcriptional regulator
MPGPVDKTTLYLDAADYRALKAIARRKRQSPAQLVREAVSDYVVRHGTSGLPNSLGLGHSGTGDLAERAEELLAGLGEEPVAPPGRPARPAAGRSRRR